MADTSDVNRSHPSSMDEADVFATALEKRSPAERAAYLAAACGADTGLRERVEQLLASHDRAGDFLERPPPAWGDTVDRQAQLGAGPDDRPEVPGGDVWPQAWTSYSPAEGPGSVVGPYRLVEKLGEGGMGVVYLAEQERPVRRTVALKIIKPGMDSEQVIARFAAERQALALMDHPNIARVLDAGATEAGEYSRPYFVMELVRGVPVTKFCDDRRLTPRQRLELFVPVCHAVQHAHTKGIIHRDIKPSNVLVTEVEGRPVPKVIDFGVAKATQQRLTERTMFTRLGVIVGTPEYMSPEQADPEAVGTEGVDARSDVYSLGVLLYELLTGTTPLEVKRLRDAGWQQMLKVIREEEPPRPSTRLSTAGQARADISAARSTEPRRLERLLAGDLDWVVMKALEKERGRRYETANGLARDVERYLTDEPVEARPPSAGYRLRKFARKHRAALRVAAGFALLLVGASVVSTWEAVRATRAERAARADRDRAVAAEVAARADRDRAVKAEADATGQRDVAVGQTARANDEAAVSRAVLGFLNDDVIAQASAFVQADGGASPRRDLTVREALDRAAARVGRRFAGRPRVEVGVRTVLGVAYQDLGEYDEARRHFAAALALARAGPQDSRDNRADVLRATINLASVDVSQGRYAAAESVIRQASETARASLGDDDPVTLTAMNNLAGVYSRTGRVAEAEALLQRVLDASRRTLGDDDPHTIQTRNNLGLARLDLGRHAEAAALLEQALAESRKAYGDEHPWTLRVMSNVASAYREMGRDAGPGGRVEDLYRQSLAGRRRALGADHPDTLESANNLAHWYMDTGRYGEAEALLADTARRARQALGDGHPQTLTTVMNLAAVYFAQARYGEAEALDREALASARAALGETSPEALNAMNNLAVAVQKQRRYADAEPLMKDVLAAARRVRGDRHLDTLTSLINLGNLYKDQGRYGDAEPLLVEALASYRQTVGDGHPDTLRAMNNLGGLYTRQGRYAEAEPLVAAALADRRKLLGDDHPATVENMLSLAFLYARQGRLAEAERLTAEAAAAADRRLGRVHPITVDANRGLTRVRAALAAEARYRQIAAAGGAGGAAGAGGGPGTTKPADGAADESPEALAARLAWGVALREAGALDEAERQARAVLQARRRAGDRPGVFEAERDVARTYESRGDTDRAAAAFYELVRSADRELGPDDPTTVRLVKDCLRFDVAAGRFDRRLLETIVRVLGPDDPQPGLYLTDVGGSLVKGGRYADAEFVLRKAVDVLDAALPDGWQACLARVRLGASLAGQKRFGEAEPLLLDGYKGLEVRASDIPAAKTACLTEALTDLVTLYDGWGRVDEAGRWRVELQRAAPSTRPATQPAIRAAVPAAGPAPTSAPVHSSGGGP